MNKELRSTFVSFFILVIATIAVFMVVQQNHTALSPINKVLAQDSTIPNSPVDSAALDTGLSQDTSPVISPLATSQPLENNQLSTKEPKKPFYQDIRYIILLVDTIIVVALVMTLIIRLTSNLFSTSAPDPILTKNQKDQGTMTIDQLDVDIPL